MKNSRQGKIYSCISSKDTICSGGISTSSLMYKTVSSFPHLNARSIEYDNNCFFSRCSIDRSLQSSKGGSRKLSNSKQNGCNLFDVCKEGYFIAFALLNPFLFSFFQLRKQLDQLCKEFGTLMYLGPNIKYIIIAHETINQICHNRVDGQRHLCFAHIVII